MVDLLGAENLKVVLGDLEKIEIRAIEVTRLIREPLFDPSLFGQFADVLFDIQRKIRDFRTSLSKTPTDFDCYAYNKFLAYASSKLDHCHKIARHQVKPSRSSNVPERTRTARITVAPAPAPARPDTYQPYEPYETHTNNGYPGRS
ncbi:unnamed protein product [Caenorhabditis sp. 36 PRJEB53466]|nr:unnamed protein product [Caenorhabditis sp. 36 PRJEB53466]